MRNEVRSRVSYGSRMWFVSFLQDLPRLSEILIYPQCCMNSWGRFSLTSEWNRCQRTHIIGWLIKLVQSFALTNFLIIYLSFEALESISSWWSDKLSKPLWLPGWSWGLYPVPTQQCLQTFQFKVRAEIAFGQKQNVFIFVSIIIKMWAWIPEEIKHKRRKQAEIESELLKLEKMMTHQPPLKTFVIAREWGVEKEHLQRLREADPEVSQGGQRCSRRAVVSLCSVLKSFERRPNKGNFACIPVCL